MKTLARSVREDIEYPSSDGEPLGENTLQVDWIVLLYNGLQAQYRDDENVMVAADLFWYPVEGKPKIVTAPDVMVAFGRPKQVRMSYLQWCEEGVAPQVVIEVRSPSNTKKKLQTLFEFYDRHGVEEYYLIDPLKDTLQAWHRKDGELKQVKSVAGWVSPRLSIRFLLKADGLHVYGADGREFLMTQEQSRLAAVAESERQKMAAKLRELGIDPESL